MIKTANDIISRELAPRLKDAHMTQKSCPISPEHIAMASAAVHLGVWKEKDVKRYLDKKFGG